jgi:NitT/TauT family transport system substrate-binding protein
MKKNIVFTIIVVAAIATALLLVWYVSSSPQKSQGAPEMITIGVKHAEANALIYIAEERGFFTSNGIVVTMKEYPTKLQAFNGMLNGDVDNAVISEYPVVVSAFGHKNISVIGSTSRFQDQYLIGRKDRGILHEQDLKGKTIGVPTGTIGEFYLGRFLALNGVNRNDVTFRNIPFLQSADSFSNGSVDAVVIFDGAPRSIELLSGDNGTVWPVQAGQASYDLLTARNDWIAAHPAAATKLLNSLSEAGEYLEKHPDEAKAIVQKRLNRPASELATIWPRFQFSLILDQSLVTAMEDEARWMIANNMTEEKTVPDFRKFIDTKSLKETRPGAVRIIG